MPAMSTDSPELKDGLGPVMHWYRQQDDTAPAAVSLKHVTAQLKNLLGLELTVNDWRQLRAHLVELHQAVMDLKSWDSLRDQRSFSQVKTVLTEQLGHPIHARSWMELEQRVMALSALFPRKALTASEWFEATKRRNFIASSRLEGITVPGVVSPESVKAFLAKLRQNRMDESLTDHDDTSCYPGTNVLVNRYGIRSLAELEKLEALLTANALNNLNFIKPPYSLNTLRSIHRVLFGDIYDWAGELRHGNISKGGTDFCPAMHLESYAATLFRTLEQDNYLQGLPRQEFCAKLAEHYCEFNMLHPFREGNGRTQRVLFDFIAALGCYCIDWSVLDAEEWIDANVQSVLGGYAAMTRLFERSVELVDV